MPVHHRFRHFRFAKPAQLRLWLPKDLLAHLAGIGNPPADHMLGLVRTQFFPKQPLTGNGVVRWPSDTPTCSRFPCYPLEFASVRRMSIPQSPVTPIIVGAGLRQVSLVSAPSWSCRTPLPPVTLLILSEPPPSLAGLPRSTWFGSTRHRPLRSHPQRRRLRAGKAAFLPMVSASSKFTLGSSPPWPASTAYTLGPRSARPRTRLPAGG